MIVHYFTSLGNIAVACPHTKNTVTIIMYISEICKVKLIMLLNHNHINHITPSLASWFTFPLDVVPPPILHPIIVKGERVDELTRLYMTVYYAILHKPDYTILSEHFTEW